MKILAYSFPTKILIMAAFVYEIALALCSAPVFAQVASEAPNQTTLLGAIIAGFMAMTGLMVWIVRKMLDVTIPGMQGSFQTALTGVQGTFQTALDKLQETSHVTFREAVANFQKDHDREQDAFGKIILSLRDEHARDRELFERKMLSEREFFGQQLGAILLRHQADRETTQKVQTELMEALKLSQENINDLLAGATSAPVRRTP